MVFFSSGDAAIRTAGTSVDVKNWLACNHPSSELGRFMTGFEVGIAVDVITGHGSGSQC